MKSRQVDSAWISAYFDRNASGYDRSMERFERFMFGRAREWVSEYGVGDVLELASGTGLNFEYYRAAQRVTAIDISTAMLRIARGRITEPMEISLVLGDAVALPFSANRFDSVVSTYSFCTFPDPVTAANEAFRVLRPGGHFACVEHGTSSSRFVCAAQHLVEPISVRFQADHLTRDPTESLLAAGFHIDSVTRERAGIVFKILASKPFCSEE